MTSKEELERQAFRKWVERNSIALESIINHSDSEGIKNLLWVTWLARAKQESNDDQR